MNVSKVVFRVQKILPIEWKPSRLKWLNEQPPEEFRGTLKGELFLLAPIGLHAQCFEVEHLIVGFDRNGFIHATEPSVIRHSVLNTVTPHDATRDRR